MLQEITPAKLRGSLMSIVTISVSVGQLYALFVASLILDSLTSVFCFACMIVGRLEVDDILEFDTRSSGLALEYHICR